jgi:hypothetical protein
MQSQIPHGADVPKADVEGNLIHVCKEASDTRSNALNAAEFLWYEFLSFILNGSRQLFDWNAVAPAQLIS